MDTESGTSILSHLLLLIQSFRKGAKVDLPLREQTLVIRAIYFKREFTMHPAICKDDAPFEDLRDVIKKKIKNQGDSCF